VSEGLYAALSPLLSAQGLELIDVEVTAGLIRVTLDRPGGVDLDTLAQANRTVSDYLDQTDPIPGRYTLEISSPGVERRLRTPAHFAKALGETISVRTHPGSGVLRRLSGRLLSCDEAGYELECDEDPSGPLRLTYEQTERARTVFVWGSGPAPSPSRAKSKLPSKTRQTPGSKTERAPTP
jgi:ribosome maturation factor RimP